MKILYIIQFFYYIYLIDFFLEKEFYGFIERVKLLGDLIGSFFFFNIYKNVNMNIN